MTAGRKPKSAALHVVGGNASGLSNSELRDRLERERAVASIESKPPVKPEHVQAVPGAAAEWDLLAPVLHQHGIVTDLDRNILAMYCQWQARYVELENQMRTAGADAFSDVTPNGFVVQSARFSALSRATEMVAKLGAKLGLAPDDRAALLRDIAAVPKQGDLFGKNSSASSAGQTPEQAKAQGYFPA